MGWTLQGSKVVRSGPQVQAEIDACDNEDNYTDDDNGDDTMTIYRTPLYRLYGNSRLRIMFCTGKVHKISHREFISILLRYFAIIQNNTNSVKSVNLLYNNI